MLKKALILMFAFLLVSSVLLVFLLSFKDKSPCVRNLNTGKNYSTIQEAIDAAHAHDQIFVASGTYYEQVIVNKSLSLIGEDRSTTIIDGNGKGKVVSVTAENVEIQNFTIRNGAYGLWLYNSPNSKVIGNTLQDGSYGIQLYHSGNSQVIGNTVHGYTKFGIEIKFSGNSTLRNNSMVNNMYNFGVDGHSLSDFINDIDVSNTVNGKPIRYLINQHNITIDSFSPFQEIGYLGIVNSTNIKVENLNVQNNVQGLLLAFTINATISNVSAKNNWNGIYVAYSSNVLISRNIAHDNFDYGIKFFNSPRSTVSGNNVDNNGWAGIGLFKSPNSTVNGNEANFNTYNLHIVYTNNSVITRNTALIKPGGYSIAVYYSHNNVIYHNSFVNSLLYVEAGPARNWTRFTPRNSWDNGEEGNHWSLYRGVDANQDGIGDTPYEVGENNIDNYPLMGKFCDFTVTLGEKSYSIDIISNSTISQFQFSPDDKRISFMATAENRTLGFSRIAVPNTLIQDLHDDNLSILINEEQPVLKREWTDGTRTYFYFSYVNSVSEPTISPWLIVALASIFIIATMLVFWILKKKLKVLSRLFRKKENANEKRKF